MTTARKARPRLAAKPPDMPEVSLPLQLRARRSLLALDNHRDRRAVCATTSRQRDRPTWGGRAANAVVRTAGPRRSRLGESISEAARALCGGGEYVHVAFERVGRIGIRI